MSKTEKVAPGKFVAFSYRLYNDADGSLLFEADKNAPDMMIYGVTQEIVPGLAAALEGLAAGDRFEVTLPPDAAFGNRSDEYVMNLEKEIFFRDGELAEEVKVGAELPMMTQEGYRVAGRVIDINDKNVVMDFNHPFAGLTVRFDGEVREVREATPEELNPSRGCCGGGCGGGQCGKEGGGCSDGSCGCDGGCN